MRRRWHVTAMVGVAGLIGLPVVPVPAGLLGIAPIQLSLPGEIAPIPRQRFGTAASGTAGAATFGSPVIITGDDTGEPGIDIAQDGTIYVNAPAGFLSSLPGSASFVYRSTDGGASWVKTQAGLRGLFPGGGDSDLSLDPETGKIYMTDLWLGSATVSFSTDQGESWIANPLEGTVVQDRQWISTPGGGTVYHLTHQIPAGLVVSKSVDGGVSFLLRTVAATPADQIGCICPPGTLISERGIGLLGFGDKVGFVYATSTGGGRVARSPHGGAAFSEPRRPPPRPGRPH